MITQLAVPQLFVPTEPNFIYPKDPAVSKLVTPVSAFPMWTGVVEGKLRMILGVNYGVFFVFFFQPK